MSSFNWTDPIRHTIYGGMLLLYTRKDVDRVQLKSLAEGACKICLSERCTLILKSFQPPSILQFFLSELCTDGQAF